MPERLPPKPATTAGQFDLFGKRAGGPRVYSVSALTRQIQGILEGRFPPVLVKGEVSNLRAPSSGHLYFTLKDADACLDAVLFRTEARRLRFSVQNGLSLVARGRVPVLQAHGPEPPARGCPAVGSRSTSRRAATSSSATRWSRSAPGRCRSPSNSSRSGC